MNGANTHSNCQPILLVEWTTRWVSTGTKTGNRRPFLNDLMVIVIEIAYCLLFLLLFIDIILTINSKLRRFRYHPWISLVFMDADDWNYLRRICDCCDFTALNVWVTIWLVQTFQSERKRKTKRKTKIKRDRNRSRSRNCVDNKLSQMRLVAQRCEYVLGNELSRVPHIIGIQNEKLSERIMSIGLIRDRSTWTSGLDEGPTKQCFKFDPTDNKNLLQVFFRVTGQMQHVTEVALHFQT